MNINEKIEEYTNNEDVSGLDSLYEASLITNDVKQKISLADGYLEYIGQCHYDFMCGKFNDFKAINALLALMDKVMKLNPDEKNEYFYRGTICEALASCSEKPDQKLYYQALCIDHLNKQNETSSDASANLAENIFRYCELKKDFDKENIQKIKHHLKEAILLERNSTQDNHFLSNTAISSFLTLTYQLLETPNHEHSLFTEFMVEFKQTIEAYKSDPMVYFYWAQSLLDIIRYNNAFDVTPLWEELKEIAIHIDDLESQNEHLLTTLGHFFETLADKESSLDYYQKAHDYFIQAYHVNKATWSNVQYTVNVLKKISLIHLSSGKKEEAHSTFIQGFPLIECSQKEIKDFQLSLLHADYTYDYAVYFENMANEATLQKSLMHYQESKVLAKNFYTQPFYGLAKIHLLLGDKKSCLDILAECSHVFSNEYHTHDFDEILNDKTFISIHKQLKDIIKSHSMKVLPME